MKKVCIGCGRNRKIGKFGKQSRMPDGKNPYCRECMREYTARYKASPKGSRIQKKSVKKYKRKNKKEIKEYNHQYYLDNKDRIIYNKICRETTECVNIFDDEPKKEEVKKINKGRQLYTIVINPKRKEHDRVL